MSIGSATHPAVPRTLGRYTLYEPFAGGGMATVHFGRLAGPAGFAVTVAIKRLRPQFASEPDVVASLLDEARLAARIRHQNVVSILDVVEGPDQLFLVMDYIEGESLARLLTSANDRGERVPLPIVVGIMVGVLHGLHAAHEAKTEQGGPLSIVHRDVSLRNVLVGVDGQARLLDFGIAKALGRLQTTREGQFKGTLGYSAPEQILRQDVDRRADIYASGVVLFRLLTGEAPFGGDEASLLYEVLHGEAPLPSAIAHDVPPALDAIVQRALARKKEDRFDSALAMADALEQVAGAASPRDIAEWVRRLAAEGLRDREQRLAAIERASGREPPANEQPAGSTVEAQTAGEATLIVSPDGSEGADPRWRPGWRAGVAAVAVVVSATAFGLLRTDGAAASRARAGIQLAASSLAPPPIAETSASAIAPASAATSAEPAAAARRGAPPAQNAAKSKPTKRVLAPGERDYGF